MKKILFTLSLITLMGCENKIEQKKEAPQPTEPPEPEIIEVYRPAIENCTDNDTLAPNMQAGITILEDGDLSKSPTLQWQEANETCALSHYELAIGTTPGGIDILPFTNIGHVISYQQEELSLEYSKDYFYALRAVDHVGNISIPIISSSWSLVEPPPPPIEHLSDPMIWLDADRLSDRSISLWEDLSNSQNIHDFTALTSNAPDYNANEKGVIFNGIDEAFKAENHDDINMSISHQKTIVFVLKTSDEINARQVIYEQGGNIRGINFYIDRGKLYCGFWNDKNDGDDGQGFIASSGRLVENTKYVISFRYDYSHYLDRDSAPGKVECMINGISMGEKETTSRLFPHSGFIGLGAMNYASHFHDGANSARDPSFFFKGLIYEMQQYNVAHAKDDLAYLVNSLMDKWGMI
jgi:hypothetical protein